MSEAMTGYHEETSYGNIETARPEFIPPKLSPRLLYGCMSINPQCHNWGSICVESVTYVIGEAIMREVHLWLCRDCARLYYYNQRRYQYDFIAHETKQARFNMF